MSPISADGRGVSLLSFASNPVEGDTNGIGDVFVHDPGSVAESSLIGTTRRAFTVSWQASGVACCRPPPTPGTNDDPFADECSAAPPRKSN